METTGCVTIGLVVCQVTWRSWLGDSRWIRGAKKPVGISSRLRMRRVYCTKQSHLSALWSHTITELYRRDAHNAVRPFASLDHLALVQSKKFAHRPKYWKTSTFPGVPPWWLQRQRPGIHGEISQFRCSHGYHVVHLCQPSHICLRRQLNDHE